MYKRPLTNNPRKIAAIAPYVHVSERVEILTPVNTHNAHYLQVKKEKLGHIL
ncbi:MAG: hypothetical protein K2O85_06760 [Helicobacter sp.]|nr:hypothetical protein [Helicobacter sp.]